MQRSELTAWLRLLLTPGVGRQTARRLLAVCGLPEEVFAQPQRWGDVASAAQIAALAQEPSHLTAQVDATWRWLHPSGEPGRTANALIPLGHSAYPPSLLETADPPLLLYVQGPAQALAQPQFFPTGLTLAIVGSRHPTAQGLGHARAFAQALGEAGLCIVSGLAQGIDAAAHEGALQARGPQAAKIATIAVVGTGLDQVYPACHRSLAQRITAQGLMVSEHPLGTPPRAQHFPQRNRIICGLSQGTLVVEAALKSGSLITARLAAEQGREVFAIPGSIHAPQSRGCHALLRQGAKLVETAQDILEELQGISAYPPRTTHTTHTTRPRSSPQKQTPSAPQTLPLLPPEENDPLLQAMGWDPMGLDALQARTGWATPELQVALLDLELAGQIARLPGGRFQRQALA